MPKPDRYSTSVVVACEGPQDGTIRRGPGGLLRRSRDGAKLAHVRADAEYWQGQFKKGQPVEEQVLLVNPTRAKVVDALTQVSESLMAYRGETGWAGGQIDFAFAGHGTENGELVLADCTISAPALIDAMMAGTPTDKRRKLAFVFDSCHSGRTLAEVLTDERHPRDFLVIDAFAACLPGEEAFELDELGHGVLTATMIHKGNLLSLYERLKTALEEGDEESARKARLELIHEPAAYLTEGEQHSLDAINGHAIEVTGSGSVEVEPETTLEELLAELRRLEQ